MVFKALFQDLISYRKLKKDTHANKLMETFAYNKCQAEGMLLIAIDLHPQRIWPAGQKSGGCVNGEVKWGMTYTVVYLESGATKCCSYT